MHCSIQKLGLTTATLFVLAIGATTATVGCGDSGESDGGKGGAGSTSAVTGATTSGGTATCQQACDYSFANCPGEFQGTKDDCVAGCQQGQPASCVDCLAHSCVAGCISACGGPPTTTSGTPTTTSGDPSTVASSSSGSEPTCGTNKLDPSIGVNCFGNDQCPTNACDNNTPNALDGYCTQACSSIADCPCDDGGHVWSCELNPKLGAVQKYCLDKSKY